ncbi:putative uncharacterized protein DDB_G0292292 [Halyomorpha halys]|uniref:putative uncharacterized protein DDB_G0292292 n=1 Tax=Halyomorpha halys TaxID=286706 RepID=UPI0006D523BD|nr:uncharacterized protein LOC106691388 [Halyomorpha halys]
MPSVTQLFAGFIVRAIINTISFLFTIVKTAFEKILYFNNAIIYSISEDNPSQDVNATTLAIEYTQDTDSTDESPKENSENAVRNEENRENDDERFSQNTVNSNENQSKSDPDNSVLININVDKIRRRIEDYNIMKVAITAVFLRCCHKCAVRSDRSVIPGQLSAKHLARTNRNANSNHNKKAPKPSVNLKKTSPIPKPPPPPDDEVEVKKKEDTDARNDEKDDECCVNCLCYTRKCCKCTIV